MDAAHEPHGWVYGATRIGLPATEPRDSNQSAEPQQPTNPPQTPAPHDRFGSTR